MIIRRKWLHIVCATVVVIVVATASIFVMSEKNESSAKSSDAQILNTEIESDTSSSSSSSTDSVSKSTDGVLNNIDSSSNSTNSTSNSTLTNSSSSLIGNNTIKSTGQDASGRTITFEEVMDTSTPTKDAQGKVIGKMDNYKFWLDSQTGYFSRMIDKTMGQESRELFFTEDGGNTWKDISPSPSCWAMSSFSFIDQQLGFFCYKWVEGEASNFYRTDDGGSTYQKVILPEVKVNFMGNVYSPFQTPEAPWKENGVLYLFDGQGDNGDYMGGNCKALYESKDNGVTWNFTGRIIDVKIYEG